MLRLIHREQPLDEVTTVAMEARRNTKQSQSSVHCPFATGLGGAV